MGTVFKILFFFPLKAISFKPHSGHFKLLWLCSIPLSANCFTYSSSISSHGIRFAALSTYKKILRDIINAQPNIVIELSAKKHIIPLYFNDLDQYANQFKEFVKTYNFDNVEDNLEKRDGLIDISYNYEYDFMLHDNSVNREYDNNDSNINKIFNYFYDSFSDRLIYYWIEDFNEEIDKTVNAFSFTDRFNQVW